MGNKHGVAVLQDCMMSLVVDCMTHGVQYLALRLYVPALCLGIRSRMYGTEQHISKALTYGLESDICTAQ